MASSVEATANLFADSILRGLDLINKATERSETYGRDAEIRMVEEADALHNGY